MKSISLCFQIHQPYRLRTYRFFDIAKDHYYYDDFQNKYIMRRIAERCYLPANRILLSLIQEYGSAFKVSFAISGSALDQFEAYTPEVIESFKQLAKTGSVEFLGTTYDYSLASLKNKDEFTRQVVHHQKRIKELFGKTPKVFSNTELIYNDEIGETLSGLGFDAQLTEGAKHVLGWKSPNFVYSNANNKDFALLLRNFQLSDDLAWRFSNQSWDAYPLTSDKFAAWLHNVSEEEQCINLSFSYDVFGERQPSESGIFEFLRYLPQSVFNYSDLSFKTPSEIIKESLPVAPLYVPHAISWADEERDLTPWIGNDLQHEAFDMLYKIESKLKTCQDEKLLADWRRLQAADHFYYMNTKWFAGGSKYQYYNPYNSPYDAFINYMNVLSDLYIRLDTLLSEAELKTITKAKGKKVAAIHN